MAVILLGFQGSYVSAVLNEAKRSNWIRRLYVDKQAIKDLTYGGINELMKNSRYFYRSTVGKNYSHWTEQGQEALLKFMSEMSAHMVAIDTAELDARAKEMVMNELKK